MSKKNRLKEYNKLVSNDLDGRIPGLSQDDGCLVKEFGKPSKPAKKDTKLEAKKEISESEPVKEDQKEVKK